MPLYPLYVRCTGGVQLQGNSGEGGPLCETGIGRDLGEVESGEDDLEGKEEDEVKGDEQFK